MLKGDKAKQKPIHMRVAEIQKERQERLYQLRNDADTNNPDLKFTPTLDQKTKEIAQRKKLPVDVTERLMKDANDKMYKKIKQGEEYQSQISSECTFQPNAQLQNRSTNEILKDNELFKQVPDFTTRQAVQADIKKERHRQLVSEHWGSEDCSFSPHISKISEYLIESKGERVNETLQEKIERLSKQVSIAFESVLISIILRTCKRSSCSRSILRSHTMTVFHLHPKLIQFQKLWQCN